GRPGRAARRMDRCQALERTAPEAGPGGGAAAGQHETDAAMIEVDEAKRRMMAHLVLLPLEEIPLGEGWGRYAARAMAAPFDHPLFDCSAMDGYAFAHGPAQWAVAGEVAAGEVFPRPLGPGECVRIFTGAMLPEGADTVVMQERARRDGHTMSHSDAQLKRGGNVRRKGEQLRAGDPVLAQGARLDAASIGLLASVGVQAVQVARKPRVAVLVSGDEFTEGAVPRPGKIFGSNGVMLQTALRNEGVEAALLHVGDDREALAAALSRASVAFDLVITTGGVSVGDHDLVRPALDTLGATVVFHGVKQKPGKPMLFAQLGSAPVFGLPGNPRAVLVLFLEYVAPFLRALQGAQTPWMRSDTLPVAHAVALKGDRAEFRAARIAGGQVHLLADEGSHMLRSL